MRNVTNIFGVHEFSVSLPIEHDFSFC